MDFHLTEEQLTRQKVFREFAEKEVRPLAREMDEKEEFDLELLQKLQKNGFLSIPYSREYGGAGADTLTYTLCMEEISKALSSTLSHMRISPFSVQSS